MNAMTLRDQPAGICGAAALDLVARRLTNPGSPGGPEAPERNALEREVPTLGSVADGLQKLGFECRFEEHLGAGTLVELPREACVIFVLPPEDSSNPAHLLVGLPAGDGAYAIVDPVGPFPDRSISINSSAFAGWAGGALVVSRLGASELTAASAAIVLGASIILGAAGWRLGLRVRGGGSP